MSFGGYSHGACPLYVSKTLQVLLVVAAGNYVSGVVHDLFRGSVQYTNSIYSVFEFGTIFLVLVHMKSSLLGY